jgi:aminoglycoside phosphotransferase (APT) family kinase protein
MTDDAGWREAAPERIAAAIEAAFPDRNVSDVGGTGPSWNEQNQTVRVTFENGEPAFLKVATDGDGSRVARERAVTDYVRAHTDIAVPDVLAAAPDGDPPHLATAPLGDASMRVQWDDADETGREGLAERIGRALAALHDQRFDRHGHVVGGDANGLDIETKPWTDVLLDRIELAESVAPADRFAHHYDEVADAVAANRDVLDDAPAALVHGDPAAPNAFPLESRVGFVDWELAHVGDPARELHRATDQLLAGADGDAPENLVDALRGGYRDRAGALPDGYADRKPVYDAERYLGRTGFFENWLEFADADAATLADRFEAEMERRLAVIR